MFNFLHNGSGAVQWSALPLAVEYFGVRDIEGLLDRLFIMQCYQRPEERARTPAPADDVTE